MATVCFTPIQTVGVPSTNCLLCPSMDLIALSGSDRLVIQRTVSWQRVVTTEVSSNTGAGSAVVYCWSPHGSTLAHNDDGCIVLYNLEIGMTEDDSGGVYRQELQGDVCLLVWAQVGLPHAAWVLTDKEKERELEWRYRSAYLDRSSVFLPPSSYHQKDGDEEVVKSPTPACKAALSLLCASTRDNNEIHLLVHGRYPIAKLNCSAVARQMVCSSDLQYLSVLDAASKLTIYSIPTLITHRYSLQIIAAKYSSIQEHLVAIREGVTSVSSSWRNTLRPLDVKMDALQKILTGYGIESDIRSVLLQHIILGKSSEHCNALDQYFTGVQMNDQLLVRMCKTLHNALAGVETIARSALLAPARSLVFDANELCGLDDELLLPETRDVSIHARTLLYVMEFLCAQLVDARFRLRDFVSWLRSAASEIKAKGTPPDSVQHENAKKRRVPQDVVHRVSDYLHYNSNNSGEQQTGTGSTESIIGSCISALLSGTSSHVPCPRGRPDSPNSVKTSLFDSEGVPTVVTALEKAESSINEAFALPRARIQVGISKTDILLPTDRLDQCTIHSRIGVETLDVDDEAKLEGSFRPATSAGDPRFSCCRQWTVAALPRQLHDGQQGVHLMVIPLGKDFVLSRCLLLPEDLVIKEVGFYGDDGKSTLSAGKEHGNGKEGRQALGLLVESESELQLWLVRYDRVQFEVIPVSQEGSTLDLSSLDVGVDSLVTIFPRREEMDEEDEEDGADPSVLYAKTRGLQATDEVVESKLLLCGSRGVGGVVMSSQSRGPHLALFDLEEDEEPDEEDDDDEMEE